MATDFAVFLHRFLTSHLAGLRGCSPNTIASYRDTFKLLIAFFRDGRSIPPDKLALDLIDAAAITGFLDWLEAERHNSISTRNQRLAAISSFFRWLQSQDPARMASCQDILAVPAKKKARPGVNHLTAGQTRGLLAQPDRSTRRGRRDATLLATLYDTAARVQELANLTVRDIRVEPPALAVLTGKGRKTRHVPLGKNTAALLDAYLAEHGLSKPGHDDHAGLQPAWEQAQPRRDRLDHPQIPDSPATRRSPAPTSARTYYDIARPCTSTKEACRCPTSAHPRAHRAGDHRDLRTRLYRGQTQSPRSRLHRHRHRRPARMEPGPRTAQLARHALKLHTRRVMRSARAHASLSPGPAGQRCA